LGAGREVFESCREALSFLGWASMLEEAVAEAEVVVATATGDGWWSSNRPA
jgi:hypothetical protein